MPIRIATAIIFVAAAAFAVGIPLPRELPAVALGQAAVYRVEILLALNYGGLLALTPFFQGVLHGRLPVEISHRGARWQRDAEERLEEAEEEISRLTGGKVMLSKHSQGQEA